MNSPQGHSDNRKSEESDAEMEETDGTPVPTAKHGSKHRKCFTIPEHHEIINCIEEYFTIDPNSILPRHRHILNTDFEALGSGPTSNRLLWLADVDTALTVSGLATSGALSRDALEYFDTPISARRSSYVSQDYTDDDTESISGLLTG